MANIQKCATPTLSPSPLFVHDITEPELSCDDRPCTSTPAFITDEMQDLPPTSLDVLASAVSDATLTIFM